MTRTRPRGRGGHGRGHEAKHERAGGPALPDGYYWLKNFVNLRGGGHVRRWKLAQIVGGRVRVVGSASELDQGCPDLRHALWVRAEPPADGQLTIAVVGRGAENRRAERIGLVAEGIVDAFLAAHPAAADHYDRHPDDRAELVARLVGLIERL